jgi:hypothetical protein
MSPLKGLQTDFKSFLLRGDERMLERVVGSAKVSAPRRLAIYYDAYRLRLIEALDSNYPVLHAWMGNDEFEQLGLAYLETHPSTHFSIRYFGHRLSEYLASAETYRDKPYLNEMAALEWAMSEAFDAADGRSMNPDDMATIPPEAWPEMRLALHASVHRLDLRWNVPAIWKAIKEEQAPGEATASEWPQPWLLWRQDLKIFFRSLSVEEAWAIDSARSSGTFAIICDGLGEWIDAQNIAVHAAGLLKKWLSDGLVNAIVLAGK